MPTPQAHKPHPPWPQPYDLLCACSLLTRLPIPVDHAYADSRGAAAAWAYPIVGIIVGAFAAAAGFLLLMLGLPAIIAALGCVSILILTTGCFHEDGLADCADGLWGSHRLEHKLRIMSDSRLGTYGTLALIITTIARVALIGEFTPSILFAVLITIAAISRVPMILAMRIVPCVSKNSLADRVGKPSYFNCALAVAIAVLVGFINFQAIGLVLFAITIIVGLGVFFIAKQKIGGQTGDVLGASQQICEIAGYTTLVVLL